MSRPSWSNVYEEEERDTEKLLSQRYGPDAPMMGWSASRHDPLGLKHAREGGMAYGPGAGWWSTLPVFWRMVLILLVLGVVAGFIFFMKSLGSGQLAHSFWRPHSHLGGGYSAPDSSSRGNGAAGMGAPADGGQGGGSGAASGNDSTSSTGGSGGSGGT